MTIPREIIEKAIEGGWRNRNLVNPQKYLMAPLRPFGVGTALAMYDAYITLDPTFWIALGKEAGWKVDESNKYSVDTWRSVAHIFYDLILTEQSTDQFWADLLTKKDI